MKLSRRKLSIICSVLTAAAVIFIWTNSMRSSDESNAQSGVFVAAISSIFGFFGLNPSVGSITYAVRKGAHMTEYAVLSFISSIAVQSGLIAVPRWRFKIVYPLFCSLLVASIDEFIQLFSNGRSSEVKDVLIDFGGAIIGAVAATAAREIYRRYRAKRGRAAAKTS